MFIYKMILPLYVICMGAVILFFNYLKFNLILIDFEGEKLDFNNILFDILIKY